MSSGRVEEDAMENQVRHHWAALPTPTRRATFAHVIAESIVFAAIRACSTTPRYTTGIPLEHGAYKAPIRAPNTCSWTTQPQLGVVELLKYLREDGVFDTESFRRAVDIVILAQDILSIILPIRRLKLPPCPRSRARLGLRQSRRMLMSLGFPMTPKAAEPTRQP